MVERRGLLPWEPREGLDSFRNEFDRIFDRFFGGTPLMRGETEAWGPAVDVIDEENQVVVRSAIPDINKENLEVRVTDDMLTISGRTEEEKTKDRRNYYIRELRSGSFRRDIPLPAEVDSEKVAASYKNGVLTITLPKIKEARAREVKVKIE